MPASETEQKCVNCGDVVGDKPHYVPQGVIVPGFFRMMWTCKRSPEREAKLQKVHGKECELRRCENCHETMVLPTGKCMQCGHYQGIVAL